ncbi:unnamed protein product, partial [Notodromas monacha]
LVFVCFSVAANEAKSSTFAFIGPEKYNSWETSNVMYVGTTFTNLGDYRHDVPAISSRRLYNMDYAEYSFSKQSFARIDVKYRDHFTVRYVYGFNTSDYAYFVTVQKQSHLPGDEEKGYVSRLARTCVSDANYDSYTEVSLECRVPKDATSYNLVQAATVGRVGASLAAQLGLEPGEPVLAAVFAPSQGHSWDRVGGASALCVYPLGQVQAKFNENVHMCFNGSMKYRNMGYISGQVLDGECPKAGTTGNILDFCLVGLKISGMTPISADAVLHYTTSSITSIAITEVPVGGHTVAFLGTSDGKLKKVLLQSGSEAKEYEEVVLDPGQGIIPDMAFDSSHGFAYIASSRKVFRVKAENCAKYTNCSSCLETGDPFCGWCSLEKRCTLRSACQNATQASPRWLSFGVGQQCIDFEQIVPDRVSIDQSATVQLTIRTLPVLPEGAKYQCVFGGPSPLERIVVDANVTKRGLACAIPAPEKRPQIPANEDHVMVSLAVRSSETNKDFVSRHLAYFSCDQHKTCISCVNSQWPCSWCLYENRCTANSTAQACPNQALITGMHVSFLSLWQNNKPSHMMNKGPQHCPRFAIQGTGNEKLLLPNGVPSEIKLEVLNLPTPPNSGSYGSGLLFHCLVTIEGAKMRVPARVENNRYVICERTMYSFEAAVAEYDAEVTVVWSDNHHVDTRPMTLYKCSVLGSHRDRADCSLCVTRNPEYRCSWCDNQCAYADTCTGTPVNSCPKPEIHVINPLNGPIEGGTLVTIEGSNLGRQRSDIEGKIHIGRIPCKVVEYKVSNEVVCRAGPAPAELDAAIVVGNAAGFTQSEVRFSYRNVEVNGIFPLRGPQSGGTEVVIQGNHLNVGSSVSVSFNGLACKVNPSQTSSGRITCTTSRSNGPTRIESVSVHIDNAVRTLSKNPYNYTLDPVISEIKPLKSFSSGGRIITVHGSNFDSVQTPWMLVRLEDQTTALNMTACSVRGPTYMECPTPPVNLADLLSRRNEAKSSRVGRRLRRMADIDALPAGSATAVILRIGFIMDNVVAVLDLPKHFHNLRSQLTYVPDPIYHVFPNNIKIYKGDTLVIEGEGLNRASDESDVKVTIGVKECNVTALTSRQLLCLPPLDSPESTDENGVPTPQLLPLVVVRVGKNLRFPLGHLQYVFGQGGSHGNLRKYPGTIFTGAEFIVGIATAVLVVLLAISFMLIYRCKSSQAEQEYKRIQIQMDTLESNVRLECKQAFAELQTDMTDMTADLESTGIPTLPHVAYVMKVFFPGVVDHPILNDPKLSQILLNGPRTNYDSAMVQFEQLVCNKMFLLTFIETLESQKSFTIRDKVNVASLLMVVLMGKLDYATEVLRMLLSRLVERAANSRHPQLMLRRTESVVEKLLTNWLAICVAGYLREKAGSGLFLLFKAIKHQVEKGPIDGITRDARYTMSEERLLREQVPHQVITIHLVQDDPHYEKIPYHAYQWRPCGRAMPLILVDDDGSTKKEPGGWRKLNTLAHYGVQDPALMALIPLQSPPARHMSLGKGCQGCAVSPYDPHPSTGTHSRFTNGHCGGSDSSLVYHLVKPVDDADAPSGSRGHKAIPEIYLTRLLATKGTIQKFVDDFLSSILTVDESLPPVIKWLFDLLDELAKQHGITDPEVIHAWKSNSLPLRFWVNFIKNPDFIFDINKTPTVDCCLSVIAQTFMDACTTTEQRLGKDSPSSKLLFAKDLPRYRRLVSKFYADVADLPLVTDQQLHPALLQLSVQHAGDFDTIAALKDLYIYVSKYSHKIQEALENNGYCSKAMLGLKLKNVAFTLDGDDTLSF